MASVPLANGGSGRAAEVRAREEYLKCGRLEAGFLELECRACGHSMLVALSCKKRGFCPACLGRRMSDAAVHLERFVLPSAPIRHWICTFPWGVPKDDAQAARLFGWAAEQGDPAAQYNLATMHENGYGVTRDPRVALEWYRRAAAGGHAKAHEAIAQIECELSASTELFGAFLLCTSRETMHRAARAAGATVVEERLEGPADVYRSTAVLGVDHSVRIDYGARGRVTQVVHEFPEKLDAKTHKQILTDLGARYGSPATSERTPTGETRQSWTLRDGLRVEYLRAGNTGSVTLRVP